jgi:molecular chaperone DnaK
MPYIQKVLLEFFGFPPKKGINPDEVVAIGAAMHGSALLGYTTDLLLLDVTPLSLGIRIHGDLFVPIIARNTPVPCKRSHFFTTIKDNQEQVEVEVYQGESQNVKENELLGKFILKGIRPAPRGEPRIEVTFQINAEGLLLVSAKDLDTGKSHEIEITTRHTLTPEEVEKISCEFGRDLLTSPAS